MIASSVIAVLTFSALTASILFFPSVRIGKIRTGSYWVIALAGALAAVLLRLVPPKEIWSALTGRAEINPLKILVLFFSMTFLSVLLDEVGLFHFLAKTATRRAGANQFLLFMLLYFLVAVLTIFTSNDIMILTLTPFICFFCKNTRISPVPYLVSTFAAANTWSMMLIIGNPTNIYLATSAGISFAAYLRVMLLPTLAAGVVEFSVIVLLFRRRLKEPLLPQADDFSIQNKPLLALGAAHLAVCLIFLVLSGGLGVEMWLVSAACALSLLLSAAVLRAARKEKGRDLAHALKRLPWQLIPFVLSMFVLVVCLRYQGVAQRLGDFLGAKACVWTYGGASFLAANLINNIPMSILFSTLPASLAAAPYRQAIYAAVIGSNIGAFLTPTGALAGIMFTDLTARYRAGYGFRQFVKYGALISLPTLAAAFFTLQIVLTV